MTRGNVGKSERAGTPMQRDKKRMCAKELEEGHQRGEIK